MKSVLISTQPKWCEKMCNVIGHDEKFNLIYEKSVEIRKTRPKIKTPFKVYIYCTKPKNYYKISSCMAATDENLYLSDGKIKMSDGFEFWADGVEYERLNGKVIGEFVCDEIIEILPDNEIYGIYDISDDEVIASCLVNGDLWDYGKGKNLYGWQISNLVIYDKPRELREFYKPCIDEEYQYCPCCKYGHEIFSPDEVECSADVPGASYEQICLNRVKTPPQSWCYVESEVSE